MFVLFTTSKDDKFFKYFLKAIDHRKIIENLKLTAHFVILHSYIFVRIRESYRCNMIEKVKVMGIELDNDTVNGALGRAELYLEEGMLHTIESVSMEMLLAAQRDEELEQTLKSLDIALIGEKEILVVVDDEGTGESNKQKITEIEENDFFFEFFKRIEQGGKSVFLLGETTEKIADYETLLTEHFPEISIVGKYATESCNGDWEAVVNDMNSTTPDVILSVLKSPGQEHFLWENKGKISANIWYGLGDFSLKEHKSRIYSFLQGKLQMNRLKDGIHKYEAAKGRDEN